MTPVQDGNVEGIATPPTGAEVAFSTPTAPASELSKQINRLPVRLIGKLPAPVDGFAEALSFHADAPYVVRIEGLATKSAPGVVVRSTNPVMVAPATSEAAVFRERSREYFDRPEWPEPRPNKERDLIIITAKPIEPSENEQRFNARARSAKLRVAEKLR